MSEKRILIEVEATTPAGDLEAAVALANRFGAELVGLFIEDAALLRFAALPFAREIGLASAARRTTGVGAMERSLKALAREARRGLASAAARRDVRWSFRVERGAAPEALLAAAAACLPGAPCESPRLLVLGDGEAEALRWAERARAARRLELVRAADLAALAAALGPDPGIVVAPVAGRVLEQAGLAELLRDTGALLLLPALGRRRIA